jgi:hypothetical protein
MINLHGMIDDQVHWDQGLDDLRVLARPGDG